MNADAFAQLVKQRRSVRRFRADADVAEGDLDRILEAGCWAPSGSNQQELRYVVLRDPARRREFAHFKKESATAPVVVLVYVDFAHYYAGRHPRLKYSPHKRRLPDIDTGLCLMNMMLMAETLGLKTLPLNVSRWLYYDSAPRRNAFDRLRLGLAVRLHCSLLGVRFFDGFTRELGLDPCACVVSAALAIGYGERPVDVASAQHGGGPVLRRPLSAYVIHRDRAAGEGRA